MSYGIGFFHEEDYCKAILTNLNFTSGKLQVLRHIRANEYSNLDLKAALEEYQNIEDLVRIGEPVVMTSHEYEYSMLKHLKTHSVLEFDLVDEYQQLRDKRKEEYEENQQKLKELDEWFEQQPEEWQNNIRLMAKLQSKNIPNTYIGPVG